ncbi:hypothetical protein IV203_006063 [Nitzschia inconspicua]|uniref:Uncharacterized protein n=1 Tax=Nitzschia inconspicua TaxID=303405 RepID=A0A9K3PJB4_9STRA|nr:hypothetical protein IV203_006063 [Nitzschia inconspicua]
MTPTDEFRLPSPPNRRSLSSHKDHTSTQPDTNDSITTTYANTDYSSHQHIFPSPQNHIPHINFGDNNHHSENNLHMQPDHHSNWTTINSDKQRNKQRLKRINMLILVSHAFLSNQMNFSSSRRRFYYHCYIPGMISGHSLQRLALRGPASLKKNQSKESNDCRVMGKGGIESSGTMAMESFLSSSTSSEEVNSLSHTVFHHLTLYLKPRDLILTVTMVLNSSSYNELDKVKSQLLFRRLVHSQLLSEAQEVPIVTPSSLPKADSLQAVSSLRAMPAAPSLGSKRRERTGIYFNNREVAADLYSSQVRYDVPYTSKVSKVPLGKPLPIPPQLQLSPHFRKSLSCSMTQEIKATCANRPVAQLAIVEPSTYLEKDRSEEEKPKKRARFESQMTPLHKRNLSNDERVFVEVALALSSRKNTSLPYKQGD